MEILLVRHGESEDGAQVRVQRAGSPLTTRGRAQARRTGAELRRRLRAARVWTSDLARATETAEIISRSLGAAVSRRSAFREISLGPWEGRLLSDLAATDGAALARWRRDARKSPRRGIEPLAAFRDRLLAGLKAISSHGNGPIVVVTHGGAISVLLTHLLGIPLRTVWQVPPEYGSISRLVREGNRFYVSSFNETGHLPLPLTGGGRRRPRARRPRSSPRSRRGSRR